MKQMIVMFVLLGVGVMEGQALRPNSVTPSPSFSVRSIETITASKLLFCCGGPMCIPGEPCGSGLVLFGTGLVERRATEPRSIVGGPSISARLVEMIDAGKLLFCCGGPVCIPNEPCGSGLSSFEAGSMTGKASESLSVAAGLYLSSRSIEAMDGGKLLFCCGGPVCIPNEPCGSGGKSMS